MNQGEIAKTGVQLALRVDAFDRRPVRSGGGPLVNVDVVRGPSFYPSLNDHSAAAFASERPMRPLPPPSEFIRYVDAPLPVVFAVKKDYSRLPAGFTKETKKTGSNQTV